MGKSTIKLLWAVEPKILQNSHRKGIVSEHHIVDRYEGWWNFRSEGACDFRWTTIN